MFFPVLTQRWLGRTEAPEQPQGAGLPGLLTHTPSGPAVFVLRSIPAPGNLEVSSGTGVPGPCLTLTLCCGETEVQREKEGSPRPSSSGTEQTVDSLL